MSTEAIASQCAGPAVAFATTVWGYFERRSRLHMEDLRKEDEQRRQEAKESLIKERERDDARVADIVQERKDLYEENKSMRTELRADIERLKQDVQVQREEARRAGAKYEAEAREHSVTKTKLQDIRNEFDAFRAEVNSRVGSGALQVNIGSAA